MGEGKGVVEMLEKHWTFVDTHRFFLFPILCCSVVLLLTVILILIVSLLSHRVPHLLNLNFLLYLPRESLEIPRPYKPPQTILQNIHVQVPINVQAVQAGMGGLGGRYAEVVHVCL